MHAKANSNFVEHLSWDGVAARIAEGAAAILPVGASAKQHGFHLPMNADRIQAEALAALVADHVDTLIWPTVAYGFYPAFSEYTGSCSLSESTFENTIEELVTALLSYNCRAVFVLDTGISTVPPVQRALLRVNSVRARHLKIHDGPCYKLAAQRLSQQAHGSHADELETSLMLALAPDMVDMERAEASPALKSEVAGPLSPTNPASPNYSRSGSFGDPTLAALAKGEILLAAMIDDLVGQVNTFLVENEVSDKLRKSAS